MRNLPIGVTSRRHRARRACLLRRGLAPQRRRIRRRRRSPAPQGVTNTAALGRVLYTQYAYLFEASGLVLLTAMIGAIVLTLHHKEGVKRQNIAEQNARTAATAVELKKQPSRAGV